MLFLYYILYSYTILKSFYLLNFTRGFIKKQFFEFNYKYRFFKFKFLILFVDQFKQLLNHKNNYRLTKLSYYSKSFKYNVLAFAFSSISVLNNNLIWLQELENIFQKKIQNHFNLFYKNISLDVFFKNYQHFIKTNMKINWMSKQFYFNKIALTSFELNYIISIKIKKNNIFLIFIDANKGKPLFFVSAGSIFKGKKKRSYLAGRSIIKTFLKLIIRFLYKRSYILNLTDHQFIFSIIINKPLKYFLIKSILTALKYFNFPIFSVQEKAFIPHSKGCKLKKLRRL